MTQTVPNHVGLILDGNRRWAKAKGLPALEGHRRGYKTLKEILDVALDRGVKYVSVFIFSTENWNRSKEESGYLMSLAVSMLAKDVKEVHKKNVRIQWLGSRERLSEKLQKSFRDAEELTRGNTRGTLALCFNYGGQREIAEAVQAIVAKGVPAENITEETVAEHLYHPEIPPVDLVVRTSGEHRTSNFMLWRAAYSELYFVDKMWPDFSEQDFDEALADYAKRARRFGG